jgi:hypothetical protein
MARTELVPKSHRGSTLDSFLAEEGVLAEFQARAIKEVIAWQRAEAMRERGSAEPPRDVDAHQSHPGEPRARSQRRQRHARDAATRRGDGRAKGGTSAGLGIRKEDCHRS